MGLADDGLRLVGVSVGSLPASVVSGSALYGRSTSAKGLRDFVSVLDFGVVNDASRSTNGAITATSHNLTATGTFVAGQTITVYGAGTAGVPLQTTVQTGGTGSCVLTAAAATTVASAGIVVCGTLNTTAMQTALSEADSFGFRLWAPTGGYLFGKLTYRNQSIVGDSASGTNFYGLPGQDVFWGDNTLTQFARPGCKLDLFTLWVDDSTDATGTITTRNGVGNAGFAWDWANGASTPPLRPYEMTWGTVYIQGVTGVNYGSCSTTAAVYCQIPLNMSTIERMQIINLAYGFWNDGPSSNLSSNTVAGDHNKISSYRAYAVDNPFSFFNDGYSEIGLMAIHVGRTKGLSLRGGASGGSRNGCATTKIADLYIETVTTTPLDWSNATGVTVENLQIQGTASTVTIAANDVDITEMYVATSTNAGPILTLNGNHIRVWALTNQGNTTTPYGRDLVADNGSGNMVIQSRVYGPRALLANTREQLTYDGRIKHVPDITPVMLGQWGNFLNGQDLLINPVDLFPVGKTIVTDFTIQADTTSITGKSMTLLSTGASSTGGFQFTQDQMGAGTYAFNVGSLLPAGKCRIYIQAKAATGGTQLVKVTANGTTVGSATLTWTTSYTVQSFDFDLTGYTSSAALTLTGNALGGSGATPLTFGGIAFMPWASGLLVAGSVGFPDPTMGQAGFYVPQRPNNTANVTGGDAYCMRFQAMNAYTIPHIAFVVTTSDTSGASDVMDVGIWDSTLTVVVGRSAVQTGNLVGAAVKTVALATPPTLVAGTVYYAVIGFGTLSSTTGLAVYGYGSTNGTLMFGTAKPIPETILTTSYTPGTTTNLSGGAATGTVPVLALQTT